MTTKIITASVSESDGHLSERPAIDWVQTGEAISFSDMEKMYKRQGGTLLEAAFGSDPFDFWFGRFYVGAFGVMSLFGIVLGVFFYFYQAWVVEGAINILQARLDPPPISAGLSLQSPGEPGFAWQIIVLSATIAFLGWALRQVDISRKLGMSLEVPMAYFAVVSSWITLQWLRPLAMGAWGNGFSLGITHHLDWVSNIGYQYNNFFFNPFHAVGVSLLFGSTLFLAMHGSAILSVTQYADVNEHNVDGFWRNILGYSIGEIGIHRLALWAAMLAVLFANLCIFLSGTLVHSWTGFWKFWDAFPVWESASAMTSMALIVATVSWRGRKRRAVDMIEYEYGGNGLEATVLKTPQEVSLMRKLFGEGQVGPLYLGLPGLLSIVTGGAALFLILEDFLNQVGYSPALFAREFFTLAVNPPAMSHGLGMAPWREGGVWLIATFLLHIAVVAWWVRIYTRARAANLRPRLAWGFAAALFLYFVIYLIRPMIIGNWAQAPGQGFRAVLDWTNNVSVLYGNFYYNPLHMVSIFFLLGSVVLLAMHGATIVATSSYGSHREIEEMMSEGTGTHRAQLFWRWTMGFNVNSKTIHDWCWWFGSLTAITGAIGLLLTGTFVENWFLWAQSIGIVAPLP